MLEWCHLSHKRLGENSLKRSNRLVLLIGIFLAHRRVRPDPVMLSGGGGRYSDLTPVPTTATIVVAAADIDLGATIQATDVTHEERSSRSPTSRRTASSSRALVVGQIARQPVVDGPGHHRPTCSTGASAASRTSRSRPAYVAMAVQVDQVSGVGTIIKAGDFVDMVSGHHGHRQGAGRDAPRPGPAPRGNATPGPIAGRPEDSRYNPTTVKTLVQGVQVLGTLLPPPPPRTATATRTPAPAPAPRRPSTASSRS